MPTRHQVRVRPQEGIKVDRSTPKIATRKGPNPATPAHQHLAPQNVNVRVRVLLAQNMTIAGSSLLIKHVLQHLGARANPIHPCLGTLPEVDNGSRPAIRQQMVPCLALSGRRNSTVELELRQIIPRIHMPSSMAPRYERLGRRFVCL